MPKNYETMIDVINAGCEAASPACEVDRIIVDANNLIYRMGHIANHRVPEIIVAFLEKLSMLGYWYNGEVHVCWEGQGNWRRKIMPTYKGNRDSEGELRSAVKQAEAQLRVILSGTKWTQWDGKECEGDDIFATLAKKLVAEGHTVGIYSSDRDLLQLATDRVTLIVPQRQASDAAMTVETVKEKYGGLGPDMLKHVKGLAGDVGDNIPGVPGIGEKTAIEMIKKHGTIFNVISAAIDVDGKLARQEGETKTAHARRKKEALGFSDKKQEAIRMNEKQACDSFLVGSICDTVHIFALEHSEQVSNQLGTTLRRLGATEYLMARIEDMQWQP